MHIKDKNTFSCLFLFFRRIREVRTLLKLMDYTRIFTDILTWDHYLVLATVDDEWNPWTAPLAYVWDGGRSLYYISHTGSVHSKNIEANPKIGFSIFHTDQIPGNAFWVQWSGIAERVSEETVPRELQEKLQKLVSLVILQREHSFYRVDIVDAFLPDATRWKTDGKIKTRVELPNKS